MKRIYTYILMMVCAMMFAGCQKDWDGILTVELENYRGSDSKVYISKDNFACWHNGDSVWLNGDKGVINIEYPNISHQFSPITIKVNKKENMYKACYPLSAVEAGGLNFPQIQMYREAGRYVSYLYDIIVVNDQVVDAPMIAYAPGESTTLGFRNAGALVAVTLPQPNKVVRMIEVTEKGGQSLWGVATGCRWENDVPVVGALNNGGSTVSLSVPSSMGSVNEGGKTFYVAIPPIENAQLQVKVIYEETVGEGKTFRYYSKTSPAGISVGRNRILPVTMDGQDKEYKLCGSGLEDDPYLIYTSVDFDLFVNNCKTNTTYEGKYIKQMEDFKIVDSRSYEGVGTTTNPFKGIYDGGNHIIAIGSYGPSLSGVFANVAGGCEIKNLKVQANINQPRSGNTANLGGIVNQVCSGTGEVKIYNCHTLAGGKLRWIDGGCFGGICGLIKSGVEKVTIKKCSNRVYIENLGSNPSIGGIIAKCESSLFMEDCVNYGTLKATNEYSDIGGMIAIVHGNVTLNRCINNGDFSYNTSFVGGLIGSHSNTGSVTIKNSANHKNSDAGLVGACYSLPLTIENCYSDGPVEKAGLIKYYKHSSADLKFESLSIANVYVGGTLGEGGKWIIQNHDGSVVYNNNYPWTNINNSKYSCIYRPNDGKASVGFTFYDNSNNEVYESMKIDKYDSSTGLLVNNGLSLLDQLNLNREGHPDWEEWVMQNGKPALVMELTSFSGTDNQNEGYSEIPNVSWN